jgi:hypothetical protein
VLAHRPGQSAEVGCAKRSDEREKMGVDDGHDESLPGLPPNPEVTDGDDTAGALEVPFSRRRMLAAGGAAAAGIGLGAVPAEVDAATGTREVGAPSGRLSATRLVGKIDQNGGNFLAYGFLTVVDGLDQAQLFSTVGDPLSESAARFTFQATASLVQREVIDDSVFVVDVVGTLTHYYQASPASSFSDPSSFAQGQQIATSSLRLQDVLSTIATNEGIPTIEGPIRQLTARRFTLGGQRLRFGHPKLATRLFATGRATRTDPVAPVVKLSIAGSTVVTG